MNTTSRMSFLGDGLSWLRGATVTVLGAGGGGSHLAQQVAHLRVGRLPFVDFDPLENHNVERVAGAGYGDVGKLKVELLAERFGDLKTRIIPVPDKAESREGRRWIEQSDIVFGAVDGARARNNIEGFCRAALVPYIDIGLKIHVADDETTVLAIGGQIVTSVPGGPCLWCAEVVTDEALLLDRQEYLAGRPEQQVVSLNGILASEAVSGMLSLMTGYAPGFPAPAVIRYDGLTHNMKPDPYIKGPCPHYPLDAAGWRAVLPPRVAAA